MLSCCVLPSCKSPDRQRFPVNRAFSRAFFHRTERGRADFYQSLRSDCICRAAAAALAADAKSAKQLAPDPDMRSQAPSSATRRRSITSSSDRGRAGNRRRRQVVFVWAKKPDNCIRLVRHIADRFLTGVPGSELGEHGARRQCDARIDQQRRQRRQVERTRELIADATHDARTRIEANRHICARSRAAAAASRGSSSVGLFTRASSRRAAAASAEPPPSPAATGMFFSSVKCPACNPATRSRSASNALSTRFLATGPQASANGPAIVSAGSPPGCKVSVSANPANATQAFEVIEPVEAFWRTEHAQCQIDLGGSLFDQRCAHAKTRKLAAVAVFLLGLDGLGLRRGLIWQRP